MKRRCEWCGRFVLVLLLVIDPPKLRFEHERERDYEHERERERDYERKFR
jgi:hypothetical protein